MPACAIILWYIRVMSRCPTVESMSTSTARQTIRITITSCPAVRLTITVMASWVFQRWLIWAMWTELPSGTFDDYCYGKLGVPTLAYLGDVDKARELLLDQPLITRTQFFRIDTEYDGDGYQEVKYPKNRLVTVKAIGVGTRAFPVKIIVEDENGEQFYQNVAMSNKYLFEGSFEFTGAEMAVSTDIKSYVSKTVHTKFATSMSSKGYIPSLRHL